MTLPRTACPGPRLLAAYRRTTYAAGGAAIRVGRRSPAMDRVLRRLGARHGAFVTAWNPLSRPMPQGWNRRMNRRLRECLRRLPVLKGTGRGRRWAERHFLVAADSRRVLPLARRFRQLAIVELRAGQAARLLILPLLSN